MTPAIQDFLDSDHSLAEAARVDFERFVLGKMVVVALFRDHKDCRFARLDKPQDEVWEVRIVDSDPQLRIFGRFAARDIFVALIGPIEHELVETDEDYEQIKTDFKNDWLNLFGWSETLIRGSSIDAYISRPFRVV